MDIDEAREELENIMPQDKNEYEVYECRICKNHYLALQDLIQHARIQHDMKWQSLHNI
jgi:hypothetical protein